MSPYTSRPCQRLLVGVTGSVHAVQILDHLRPLRERFADEIKVIMTATAAEMIPPRVVELVADEVHTGIWGTEKLRGPHIKLAEWAQLFVVVPATANVLAKAAHGIADDLLTTALLAADCPTVFAPAMNPLMWRRPVVRRNVEQLRRDGHVVIQPSIGASVTTGRLDVGLTPTPETVMAHCMHTHMRTLRGEYWREATATPPRTPAAAAVTLLPASIPVAPERAERSGSSKRSADSERSGGSERKEPSVNGAA